MHTGCVPFLIRFAVPRTDSFMVVGMVQGHGIHQARTFRSRSWRTKRLLRPLWGKRVGTISSDPSLKVVFRPSKHYRTLSLRIPALSIWMPIFWSPIQSKVCFRHFSMSQYPIQRIVMFEAARTTAWKDSGAREVLAAISDRLRSEGWSSVRSALAVTVR